MKRFAIVASTTLALVLGAAGAPTAYAADYPIIGRIGITYRAAGGAKVMGDPLGPRQKVRISSTNGYSQKFESLSDAGGVSTVLWNRKDPKNGWVATASSPNPKLSKVTNDRDALAAAGLAQGLVYRSADLTKATTSDKLSISGLLRGGVLIDLRGTGTKDPNLPGVTEVRYAMTGTTNLTTFVTNSKDRAALGKAYKAIIGPAATDRAVLIHCKYGKDRTGWAVAVLQSLLGAPDSSIRADYLRSSGVKEQWLSDGLAAVAARYPGADRQGATHPGIYRYVTEGLGLSAKQVKVLRAALA